MTRYQDTFGRHLVILFMVATLGACSMFDKPAPLPALFAIESEYITLAEAAVGYVESETAKPAIKDAIKMFDKRAYDSIQEAKILARAGAPADDAIEIAEAAMEQYKAYLVSRIMGAPK